MFLLLYFGRWVSNELLHILRIVLINGQSSIHHC